MNCTICDKSLPENSFSVLNLNLCPECLQKLLDTSASQPEYDWFVSHVTRDLTEPLLQGSNIVPFELLRCGAIK